MAGNLVIGAINLRLISTSARKRRFLPTFGYRIISLVLVCLPRL